MLAGLLASGAQFSLFHYVACLRHSRIEGSIHIRKIAGF